MSDMYKNQLQELAQRSCFNLPSYACIREGPDHAPRFKASVNFNGEIFESPSYCTTLRQAEHAAAEVALNVLSTRGPSRSLTARILDETGIYKNLLQETAHRAGLNLPVYTTVRSGPGHVPIFTCAVELAGMNFTGEPAKTKKQAEKNAAIAAWSALKKMPNLDSLANKETDNREEQDQAIVARFLSNFRTKDDNRNARRRDQNQTRRRMVRSHRDSVSAFSSSSSNSVLCQQWRLVDMLIDSALDVSTKKQNSFVSLLPPPPPRATSKILPPTSRSENQPSLYPSYRPIPIQIRPNSKLKMQETAPATLEEHQNRPIPTQIWPNSKLKMQETPAATLEEHQRGEEEWLCMKQDVIKKPIEKEGSSSSNSSSIVYGAKCSIYKPLFPQPDTRKLKTSMFDSTTQISNRFYGCLNPSPITPTPIRAKSMYTGGFNPQRIAPAVQIRSVIPVCAAPPSPMKTPSSSSNPSSMKEASPLTTSFSPSTTPMSTQTGAAEDSSASSTLFNNPTQVSSEFNNLQLRRNNNDQNQNLTSHP